jgi:hypothetical protein
MFSSTQKLAQNLKDGLYPSTWGGFDLLCRHAKLLGSNCTQYNKAKEYQQLGKAFSKRVADLVLYKETQAAHVLEKRTAATRLRHH